MSDFSQTPPHPSPIYLIFFFFISQSPTRAGRSLGRISKFKSKLEIAPLQTDSPFPSNHQLSKAPRWDPLSPLTPSITPSILECWLVGLCADTATLSSQAQAPDVQRLAASSLASALNLPAASSLGVGVIKMSYSGCVCVCVGEHTHVCMYHFLMHHQTVYLKHRFVCTVHC